MIKSIRRKLAERPRLRIVVLIVGVILVLIIGARFMTSRAPVQVGGSGVEASKIGTQVGGRPQGALPQQKNRYQRLADHTNQQHLNQVAESGSSYFKGIFANGQKVPAHHALMPSKPVVPVETPQNKAAQGESPVAFMNRKQNQGNANNGSNFDNNNLPSSRQGSSRLSALQEAMRAQLMGKSDQSGLPTQQSVVGEALPEAKAEAPAPAQVIIKAGTILFAVLDTALNSDQPGTPVLAKIVSGKYRGSKLMGSFVREKDKLVVRFDRINIPHRPSTLSISAYAISAETAQNALASSVNHHYLYRYGSLFAAGFLQGFGNAFDTVQPTCPPGSPCTIIGNSQASSTTTKQAVYQGLGQLGTNWGNVLAQNFNIPPTVKLKQGVGLGILFMSDVSLSDTNRVSNAAQNHTNKTTNTLNGLTKDLGQ